MQHVSAPQQPLVWPGRAVLTHSPTGHLGSFHFSAAVNRAAHVTASSRLLSLSAASPSKPDPFSDSNLKLTYFRHFGGAARCPHYKSRLLLWQLRVNDSKREQDRRPAPTLSPHPPPPGSHPVSSSPCPGQDTQQAACLRAAAKTRAWPSGWARPPHWPEIHFPVLLFLGSQVRLAPLLRSECLHPPQFMCEILAPKGDRVGRGSFGRVIKSRGRSHLEWDLCPERSCRGPLPPPPVRTEKAPT